VSSHGKDYRLVAVIGTFIVVCSFIASTSTVAGASWRPMFLILPDSTSDYANSECC